MLRAGLAVALAAALASTAAAQTPAALSPRLAEAARRDTTVLAWVIARAGADLALIADRVRAAGGRVRHVSRFVHGVSAVLPGSALAPLARERGVRRVQPVAVFRRETRSPSGPGTCAAARARECLEALPPDVLAPAAALDTLYGPGAWAFRMLGVPALHALGLRGAGVRIALLDSGFNTLHPYLAAARVVAQRDFVYGDSVVRDEPDEIQGEHAHGTAVWALLAADAPAYLVGVAPDAEYLLAKTEYDPTETRIEEDRWVAAVEWADSAGAHIVSSSLGYLDFDDGFGYDLDDLNGDLAVTTVAADAAAARGILVVVSAGSGGPAAGTIGTPADGDSVVAVGAVDSTGALAAFSSRGPTGDGRIKPEVVAPGVRVTTAAPADGLSLWSGTSFAAPLVAGLAALVQGTRAGRPAVGLRAGILAAGDDREAPANDRGHGLPDAVRLLARPVGLSPIGPLDSVLTSVTPRFEWTGDAGGFATDTFRLEVAEDSLFARPVLDTVTTGASVSPPRAARSGSRIWWRVSARSALGVTDSIPRQGPHLVPEWATLLSFADPGGASTRDPLPRLEWRSPPASAPPGPFRYDIAVYPSTAGPDQAVAAARNIPDTVFRPSRPLELNLPYRWQVVARLGADSAVAISRGTFVVITDEAPPATLLFQNFPNPFPNAALGLLSTCIWFDLARRGDVRLEILDLRGRLVRRLAPADGVPAVLDAGRYGRPPGDIPASCDERFAWDGRDDTGAYVRPGVYLSRLTTPGFRDTKRIVYRGAR